tara:strand:+ start:148 stop:522 length:375 start_codon:yes stop_codon:yes gene_type:complete
MKDISMVHDYDDMIRILEEMGSPDWVDPKIKNRIVFDDLFSEEKTYYIVDEGRYCQNGNGKELLTNLKEKAIVVSEITTTPASDYNLTESIHNVYEYDDWVVIVTSKQPRSLKHTAYQFACHRK